MSQGPSMERSTRRLEPDAAGIAAAAELLRHGGLVAFPTETVYGIGADAADARAVAALYAAKGRPAFNPLIAHFADLEAARREGCFDARAERLAEAFWPGALTLVLPLARGASVCDLARAGLDSVALRLPAHKLAQELLRTVGRPVVAPSANRSGHVSPTTPEHVIGDLGGRIDAVIAAGPAAIGLESTIIACLGGQPRLLRAGGITREAVEGVVGALADGPGEGRRDGDGRPIAPGLLASHYAPRARLRLQAARVSPGEAVLLFGRARPKGIEQAAQVLNLSRTGDLTEAAANLFAYLRALDVGLAAAAAPSIAVAAIPESGLGEAINDRLRRAAAER